MTQCDRNTTGHTKRGRGTGEPSFFYGAGIKSKGKEGRDLIGSYSETVGSPVPRPLSSGPSALDRYLAANPAMTARDFKGKGFTWFSPFDKHYVGSTEKPWHKLDVAEVRRAASRSKARFLSRGQRQAAARDPGLIWDEDSRSYRLRDEATPAPQAATETVEGEPHPKVRSAASSRPAAGNGRNANTDFQGGDHA